MAELDAAAEELAREVPDAVVLAGGDGSYMAGVTALVRSFAAAGRGEDALPPIALAPGGTVSTVARNWGFRGGGLLSGGEDKAARYASRLLDAVARGRATVTERPTLRAADERATRVGFIVGAGLVSRFFEVYDEEGARGYRGAASIVARVFAGSFARGALAQRILTPVPVHHRGGRRRRPLRSHEPRLRERGARSRDRDAPPLSRGRAARSLPRRGDAARTVAARAAAPARASRGVRYSAPGTSIRWREAWSSASVAARTTATEPTSSTASSCAPSASSSRRDRCCASCRCDSRGRCAIEPQPPRRRWRAAPGDV